MSQLQKFDPEKLQQVIELQRQAANPYNSVFVAASAGSGKTKILSDRVLRLLLNGVSPDKILCLTFTKVGAFEMQNRIYGELIKWATLDYDKLNDELFVLSGKNYQIPQIKRAKTLFNEILDNFEGIKINTIHSFCQNLMAKFPIESQIKPNFQVIDSITENQLLVEAKNELLQRALNDKNLAEKISDISASLNEKSFLEIILELINKRSDLENTKKAVFGIKNLNQLIFTILNCDDKTAEEINHIINNPNEDSEFDYKNITKLTNLAKESNKITNIKNYNLIEDYLTTANIDNFLKYSLAFLTKNQEAKKQVFTKEVAREIEEYDQIIAREQKRLINIIEKINALHIAKSSSNLLEVSDAILQIYAKLKERNNYLDYNDLIANSARLLQNSENSEWIKYKMDGAIEHILVDESQDTNDYQWQIIKAISDDFFSGNSEDQDLNRTIFVVGDEKQSIYSFQGADPKIFGNILQYYSKKLRNINKELLNINLNKSFRSLKNILQAVDDIFTKAPYKTAISPINLVKHQAIRKNYHGKIELWPIVNLQQKKLEKTNEFTWDLDFEEQDNQNAKEILAQIIAKKIKKWLHEKYPIRSENRPIKAGDIMILLKNRTNNLGNLIVRNLQNENIAVSGNDKIALMSHIIFKDLLAIAKFLLLNEDDLNLAALLKSPFIELSEADLLKLCQKKNQDNLSLFAALQNIKAEPFIKALDFLEDIKKYHEQRPYKIYQLFNYILDNKDKKAKLIEYSGKEAIEIINQFLNLCLDFHQQKIPSLEIFVNELEKFEMNIKIDNNSNDFDEVKVTTIHSAKGLESKIVILADCAHNLKSQYGSNNDKILWISKNGIKIPIWPCGKTSNLTKEIKEYDLNIKQEEYLRLLYVAMTRAEDELYIAGFGDNISENCWYNIIKNNCFNNAKIIKNNFAELLEGDCPDFSENDEILKIEGEEYKKDINYAEYHQKDGDKVELYGDNMEFLGQDFSQEKTENIIYPSQQKDISTNIGQLKQNDWQNIGNIIHKILEIFIGSDNCKTDIEKSIKEYLEKQQNHLEQKQKNEILRQVLTIINHNKFNFLFSKNAKSEVPIIGNINGKIVMGKIDRLIVEGDQVIIIDYKSDRLEKSEIDQGLKKYQEQLKLYQKIMADIYPTYQIKCAIIWTYLGDISFYDKYLV